SAEAPATCARKCRRFMPYPLERWSFPRAAGPWDALTQCHESRCDCQEDSVPRRAWSGRGAVTPPSTRAVRTKFPERQKSRGPVCRGGWYHAAVARQLRRKRDGNGNEKAPAGVRPRVERDTDDAGGV